MTTTDETMTIQQFIEAHGITMTADRVMVNPNMADSADMDNWLCYFHHDYRAMLVYFSMGSGHHGRAPEVGDVLDSLATEAQTIEAWDVFEDWAVEMGFDPDSRKAERTFTTIQEQTRRLGDFLGMDAYLQLLDGVERL